MPWTNLTRGTILAALLGVTNAYAPSAAGASQGFDVQFDVIVKGVTVAETAWSLTQSPGRYHYESRSETRGLMSLLRRGSVVESSEGTWSGTIYKPTLYSYHRTGSNKPRHVRVSFDWAKGVAANSLGNDTWRMAVPAGTLDKISFLLAMMRDLKLGKRDLRYSIADGGKLKTYALDILGEDHITTALGSFEVTKVRRKRPDSARETVFWCAKALGFLPVRVTHRESNGATLELSIRRITHPALVHSTTPVAN